MPATVESIFAAMDSPDFTPEERVVIAWQYNASMQMMGGFLTALWEAIALADDDNLDPLECGFPLHVRAYRDWSQGDMGQRIRAKGLSI